MLIRFLERIFYLFEFTSAMRYPMIRFHDVLPVLSLVLACGLAVRAEAPPVVSQEGIGENACGPCAAVNAWLRWPAAGGLLAGLDGGSPREMVGSLIRAEGAAVSVVYGAPRLAYSEPHGTADADMLAMMNARHAKAGMAKLQGVHLEAGDGETAEHFHGRVRELVRGSLAAGFPPILSVRAMVASPGKDGKNVWNSLGGHWVVLTALPCGKDATGSYVRIVDSLSGRELGAYFHSGHPRACTMPMDFTLDGEGKEVWRWVKGDRCHFLSVPGMPLATARAPWDQRTEMVVRYLIYLPAPGAAGNP